MQPKEKINGVNLGNWLVLEKWMSPALFEEYGVEDEIWLHRTVTGQALETCLQNHRDRYITREDFRNIAAHGMNLVRIPVPFFVFGDRAGHPGCIAYLDKAMEWAEEFGILVLIDLHTVEGSQNGYDNGGLTGVCKWHKNSTEVDFSLSVLERLGRRYGTRKGLFGIEVLNEPISWLVYKTAPSTGKAREKSEAAGSGYVPMKFLKAFYQEAYSRLREVLPKDKTIVFHDGFRLGAWKNFFVKEKMENVMLDTHIYIDAMELFMPVPVFWIYKLFVRYNKHLIHGAARYTPVLVGEWNIENRRADRLAARGATMAEREALRCAAYRQVAALELDAYQSSAGCVYWNYQLEKEHIGPECRKENGDSLEGWDLVRTWNHGWLPEGEEQG